MPSAIHIRLVSWVFSNSMRVSTRSMSALVATVPETAPLIWLAISSCQRLVAAGLLQFPGSRQGVECFRHRGYLIKVCLDDLSRVATNAQIWSDSLKPSDSDEIPRKRLLRMPQKTQTIPQMTWVLRK